MKKILFAAAIAALAISCGKKAPEIAPAKQEAHAGTVEITGTPIQTQLKSGVHVNITQIEFMRDGVYIGQGYEDVKAETPIHYFSGTFTVNGEEFILSGDFSCKIKVNGKDITFTLPGSEVTSSGTFTETPPPTTDIEKALFVNWKISQLEVAIDRPSISHKFTGAQASNMGTIAEFVNANQKQVELDVETFQKYVISTISLSSKSVVINFTDPQIEPITGKWLGSGISITNQTFKYKLNAEMDGKLFEAEASGSFTFSSDFNTVTITLNVESNEMNGKIIITATKA